ncbi:GNAT family N-acetyltransferase [Brevibacterium yomogidense]|uniref:GNAT family N-acetyltransferase n=1 Tax=Brevibacterium yomogidense TaxID=946573 RepID=UPI0018E00B66
MSIDVTVPVSPAELDEVVDALRGWQADGEPMQLHPGDIGWFWRFGTRVIAESLRVWRRNGRIEAVGLLDGAALLRLGVSPEVREDPVFLWRLASDVMRPDRGVLPAGGVAVEARFAGAFRDLLLAGGWRDGEPWTPLSRDLTQTVRDPGARVEVATPDTADLRTAVQRAAFSGSTFSTAKWRTMAGCPVYRDARCLVAYDDDGTEVAAATAWSAGPGRPGVLEPVGVHPLHRGLGYGRAITVAAAAALRDMGATSALVCTETANVAAVATYRSAGFEEHAAVPDIERV